MASPLLPAGGHPASRETQDQAQSNRLITGRLRGGWKPVGDVPEGRHWQPRRRTWRPTTRLSASRRPAR